MKDVKSENSDLFKDFCNAAEKEKNKQDGILYLIIVPKRCRNYYYFSNNYYICFIKSHL